MDYNIIKSCIPYAFFTRFVFAQFRIFKSEYKIILIIEVFAVVPVIRLGTIPRNKNDIRFACINSFVSVYQFIIASLIPIV